MPMTALIARTLPNSRSAIATTTPGARRAFAYKPRWRLLTIIATSTIAILGSACASTPPRAARVNNAGQSRSATSTNAYGSRGSTSPTPPGSVSEVPLSVITTAAHATLAKGTAETSTAGKTMTNTMIAYGSFNLASGTGTATVGAGPQAAKRPAIIITPSEVYIASTATNLPAGKQWLSITTQDQAILAQSAPYMLIESEALNPSMYLIELADGTESATPAGTAKLNLNPAGTGATSGPVTTPTKVYDVTIDIRRASSAATGLVRTAIEEEALVAGSEYIAMTVWIDGSGLVRRAAFTEPQDPNLKKATLTLASFGVPVQTTVPNSQLVVNISALASRGELAGGDSDGDG